MKILTVVFVRIIVSSIRTNRAKCALYKKILDLLDEESVSGESNVRELVYKFEGEVLLLEKVSRSLKYDSNFFVHNVYTSNRKNIYK